MGYKSRIYVVQPTTSTYYNKEVTQTYCIELAKFNLGKVVYSSKFTDIFTKESDYFLYADDGNTILLEDKYDKPLRQCSIADFMNFNTDNIYINSVKQYLEYFTKKYNNLVILHYGY